MENPCLLGNTSHGFLITLDTHLKRENLLLQRRNKKVRTKKKNNINSQKLS
jgi:hypothetical protein